MTKNKELILSLEKDTNKLKQILEKGSLTEKDKSTITKWISKAKRILKVFEVDDPQLDTDITSFDITADDYDINALKNIISQVEGLLESLKIENKDLFKEYKNPPRFEPKY